VQSTVGLFWAFSCPAVIPTNTKLSKPKFRTLVPIVMINFLASVIVPAHSFIGMIGDSGILIAVDVALIFSLNAWKAIIRAVFSILDLSDFMFGSSSPEQDPNIVIALIG
jgi:hypothetical protein